MATRLFYIDPQNGSDSNDGLSPAQPLKTHEYCELAAGDSMLFKCGSILRGSLHTRNGSAQGTITYGSYGIGNKPVFLGSVSASDPEKWVEDQPSIWRYTNSFASEVCNLIFNHGVFCGNLRWNMSVLKHQGEWYYTEIGQYATDASERKEGVLYLYSACNPGVFYNSIECALWGKRKLVGGEHNIVLEDLVFSNAGVHGFQSICAYNITIRNCEFHFIGGAVWDPDRHIRFGNAVEFWNDAHDIKVENCIFKNIYDSGVTHQGEEKSGMPERIYFCNNLFVNCGMAAYECRGPAAREVYFENNTCVNAGGGFAMQGETPPRQSEIYPQPMGHHVFIWRIDKGTQSGLVYIRNNIFYDAPYGVAVYSIIDAEDERQFVIDNNCYWQISGDMFVRLQAKYYLPSQFTLYQNESENDGHSIYADPLFVDVSGGDYHLQKSSPCSGAGMRFMLDYVGNF